MILIWEGKYSILSNQFVNFLSLFLFSLKRSLKTPIHFVLGIFMISAIGLSSQIKTLNGSISSNSLSTNVTYAGSISSFIDSQLVSLQITALVKSADTIINRDVGQKNSDSTKNNTI